MGAVDGQARQNMNASGERTRSLWMGVEVAPEAVRLDRNQRCDTVVVGAGIAGLSTAYELVQAGQKVIVLDRGPIAGGMTAHNRAFGTSLRRRDQRADQTARQETTRLFQQSQKAAVARIERRPALDIPAISAASMASCFRRWG